MKSTIRDVNEGFGSLGEKFKMYVIIWCLENFISHFLDNHSNCDRFKWSTRCAQPPNVFHPSKDYIQSTSCNRVPECQAMVVLFFEIFVNAFIYSAYCESIVTRTASYEGTSMNESYNHSVGLRAVKAYNLKPSGYIANEAAAFIDFTNM